MDAKSPYDGPDDIKFPTVVCPTEASESYLGAGSIVYPFGMTPEDDEMMTTPKDEGSDCKILVAKSFPCPTCRSHEQEVSLDGLGEDLVNFELVCRRCQTKHRTPHLSYHTFPYNYTVLAKLPKTPPPSRPVYPSGSEKRAYDPASPKTERRIDAPDGQGSKRWWRFWR